MDNMTHWRAQPLARADEETLTLDGRIKIAELLFQAKNFPDIASAAQAFARIQAGHEMGIGPMTSLREISILPGGRPVLSAHMMAVLIARSGKYKYVVNHCHQTGCKITFYSRDSLRSAWEELGSTEFTLEMARKAMIYEKERGAERSTAKALAEKWNYKSWAEDMFFARAMSRGAKRYCAEVFGGAVYLEAEMPPADFDPEPSVISVAQAQQHIQELWGHSGVPAQGIQTVRLPDDAPTRPHAKVAPKVAPGPDAGLSQDAWHMAWEHFQQTCIDLGFDLGRVSMWLTKEYTCSTRELTLFQMQEAMQSISSMTEEQVAWLRGQEPAAAVSMNEEA